MERTAVRRRLSWQAATVTSITQETAAVCTIELDPPDWPGHRAGEHLDVRLTADDGYMAARSYSIASAPGEPVAITVQRLEDGEVSPYLTEELRAGDKAGEDRTVRGDRRTLMDALDGNAIGGMLIDVFGTDMTAASSTCGTCGTIRPVAELLVYMQAPGVVVRCRTCESVVMVFVKAHGVTCAVDLAGMASLSRPEPT